LWFDVLASPFEELESPQPITNSHLPLVPDVGLPFKDQVASYEKLLLEQALTSHQHHQSRTAQALGLSYHQLRGMLKKHALVGDAND
jgi:psp operon transcriptional activator